MLSNGVSGNNNGDLILQLAHIMANNPGITIDSIYKSRKKYGRSLGERQVLNLIEKIGEDRQFSLSEVVELSTVLLMSQNSGEKLLVSPSQILDFIPDGKRVKSIQNYLEEIIKRAKREIILLAPFWDVDTIIDLLRCLKCDIGKPELVLLLVYSEKKLFKIEEIINNILSVWSGARIRLYIHQASIQNRRYYPHAKCLIIDRINGYLGSANFTGPGMHSHFEIGISLSHENSKTLGDLIQYLWSSSSLFKCAWDNSIL